MLAIVLQFTGCGLLSLGDFEGLTARSQDAGAGGTSMSGSAAVNEPLTAVAGAASNSAASSGAAGRAGVSESPPVYNEVENAVRVRRGEFSTLSPTTLSPGTTASGCFIWSGNRDTYSAAGPVLQGSFQ